MSPNSLRWIVIMWFWCALGVAVELRHWPLWLLQATQLPCFFASAVPFFRARVGLLRWGLFALWISVVIMCIVIQWLRSIFQLS